MPWRRMLGADSLLLAELAFHGAYAHVGEELFHIRRMPGFRDWGRYFHNLRLDFSPAGMVPTWNRPIVLDPFQSYVPLTMKRY